MESEQVEPMKWFKFCFYVPRTYFVFCTHLMSLFRFVHPLQHPAYGFMLNFILALPILCYCSTNEWYNGYFMHIITCRHCFNAQYLFIYEFFSSCWIFFISVCTTFEMLCSCILFTTNSNSTEFSSYFMYIYFIIIGRYVLRRRKMYAHVNTITSIFVCCGQNADVTFSYTIHVNEKKTVKKNYYEKSTYEYDEILSSLWNGLTITIQNVISYKYIFIDVLNETKPNHGIPFYSFNAVNNNQLEPCPRPRIKCEWKRKHTHCLIFRFCIINRYTHSNILNDSEEM